MPSRRMLVYSGLLIASAAAAAVSTLLPHETEVVRAPENPRALESRAPSAALPDDPTKPRFSIYTGTSTRTRDKQFVYFLDGIPERIRSAAVPSGTSSNVDRKDYNRDVKVCADCHEENYEKWSRHPHRFMNQDASPDRVVADFSGASSIEYMGGKGTFFMRDAEFRVRVERKNLAREFRITRTIGSRFFQYYVGVQLEGPEPKDDQRYSTEQVLPFGWWMKVKRWVPVVHLPEIGSEYPDSLRSDVYEQFPLIPYYNYCHYCHTTLAQGDWMLLAPAIAGRAANSVFGVDVPAMLTKLYPDVLSTRANKEPRISNAEYDQIWTKVEHDRWPEHTVALGITCEACHNGTREHLDDPDHVKPMFMPVSPNVVNANLGQEKPFGRTVSNINFICGRCHNSARPAFPDGAAVWNSAEHRDMMLSRCSSALKCTKCHDPHQSIGEKWTLTDDQNDALCLDCHKTLADGGARATHTHHASGTAGDRCMNCHMPYVDEGLQDVARTHTIKTPTDARTIEQNGPNACNLCHLEKSIDWTLTAIKDWYGKSYDAQVIASSYRDRTQPMVKEWLAGDDNIRLVASGAIARSDARWALPLVFDALDDPVMTNRQFAQLAIEKMLGTSLWEQGYIYWQSSEERRVVIAKLKSALLR